MQNALSLVESLKVCIFPPKLFNISCGVGVCVWGGRAVTSLIFTTIAMISWYWQQSPKGKK